MLDAFGLINMNGRMYDPVIGRILSPDKYVQSPTNTQSYNRYTYCFNNPLKYTDPSGWIAPECDGPVFVWLGGGFGPGPRGGVGPGSGNHWSDGVRDEWGNFMLMSAGTFTGIYGQNEYDKIYNAVTGNAYTITDREAIKAFMQALKEQSEKARQQAEDQKHAAEIANGYPGGGMSFIDPGDPPPGKNGHVISIANGAAAYGLFGIMCDFGFVTDSYGNSSQYFTFGWMRGYGAAAGMGASVTNRDFSIEKFAGWASGFMLQIPYSPVGIEGYTDISHGEVNDHYGLNLWGIGGNIGPGSIYGWYTSYTILVPNLPQDFWTRPGRH